MVADRRLGPRAPQGSAGSKQEREILGGLCIVEYPVRRLQQAGELDEGRNSRAARRYIRDSPRLSESKRTEPRLVVHQRQEVAREQGPRCATLGLSARRIRVCPQRSGAGSVNALNSARSV